MTKIRDVMTRDVVAVSPATSVMDAAKTMIEQEKAPCRWWKEIGPWG